MQSTHYPDTRTDEQPDQLTVLFDGGCPLCRREIAHVQGLANRQDNSGLHFVDISDSQTVCSTEERTALLARFHVEKPDGSRLSGAAAFVAMWERLPGWRILARIAKLPGMLMVFEGAYRLFLKLRPGMQAVARRLEGQTRPH